jgi:hypothetical protein
MPKIQVSKPTILDGVYYGKGVHDVTDAALQKRLILTGAQKITGTETDAADDAGSENDENLIPEDFPSRAKLAENGITRLDQLEALERSDLIQMDGIGEVTADKILEARDEL